MDAGMSNVAAGSWDASDEALTSSNGLVSGAKVSTGIVELTLLYPVDAASFVGTVTQRGTPAIRNYGIVHTSDTVKRIVSLDGSSSAADMDFDFHFLKMAQGV